MPDYHEYHFDIEDDNGERTETVHVHDDHHQVHGFDKSGALKNVASLVSIIAGTLGIHEYAIKNVRYYGKIFKKG